MAPSLENLEASIATTETCIRWLALLAAIFTFSAAAAGVRLWLLQGDVKPLRDEAKLASEARISDLHLQIAAAQKSAAEANEKAEKEKLERISIAVRLADRHVSAKLREAMVSELRQYAGI